MTSRNWNTWASLGLAIVTAVLPLCIAVPSAQAAVNPDPTVVEAALHDMSKPLTDIHYSHAPMLQRILDRYPNLTSQQIQAVRKKMEQQGWIKTKDSKPQPPARGVATIPGSRAVASDSVLQARASATQSGAFTLPVLSFDGLGNSTETTVNFETSPADPDVAVGMRYVVESVENEYAVYDKADGSIVFGPAKIQAIWNGFGGNCERQFMNHPVVVYDQLAHRWIFQAAMPYSSGLCVAVSRTNDPTGEFYRYEFDNLPPAYTQIGYTHLGVWSDAYYATVNMISGWPQTVSSVSFIALDRSAMLQGKAAQMVIFNKAKAPGVYADLPATLDGETPPPSGEPGLFASYISPNLFGSGQPYALALWTMHVDWTNPRNSTLQGPSDVTVPAFNDMLCGNQAACIPQPFPGDPLDAASDRLMSGLAYRNFVGHEALVVNQTVTADASGNPPSGIRWYELDTSSAGANDWSLGQSGTYEPGDGASRWMGSMAMDSSGDIALGYSLAGTSMAPAIAYTGRKSSDTDGKMTEPETTLVAGVGVQQQTQNAWGGHSSMAIDPAGDCTFWYAAEYYEATGSYRWSTHLGAFKFGSCVPTAPGMVRGTVTSAASGQTIAGAAVVISPEEIAAGTDSSGSYQMNLPAGTYSATASRYGYLSQTISVTVSNGGTASGDFSLQKAPTATLSGHVTDGSGHGYGLYAEVKITNPDQGVVADLWTDPSTGAYSVALPKGYTYTITVAPYVDGYVPPAPTTLTLANDQAQDYSLTVDSTCSAPGYAFDSGFGEDFNGATFPPSGWTVTNGVTGSHVVWNTNTYWNDPWGSGNYTGGTGTAAMADSYASYYRFGNPGSYDTALVSPPIPVTSTAGEPILDFKMNGSLGWQDYLDVDISVDNGPWVTAKRWNAIGWGGGWSLPGYDAAIALGQYIPSGAKSFRLRWHYYDLSYAWNMYVQVDDVSMGVCHPLPGGLVVGHVTDANTGAGLADVAVSDDTRDSTTTIPALASAHRAAGTYLMFVGTGQHSLTATTPKYSPASASVNVADDGVTVQDLSLGAGSFSATPSGLTLHAEVGSRQDAQLTITNGGTAAAHFVLQPINAPVSSSATQAVGPFAPAPNYAQGTDLSSFSAVELGQQPGSGPALVRVQAAASATAGTVIAAFASPVPFYGLGVDRQARMLWLSSPSFGGLGGDDKDHAFQFDGTATGKTISTVFPGVYYMADTAYDDVTGVIWQLSIDEPPSWTSPGTSHIYELDPRSGLPTGKSILVPTPQPERGLAYDPVSNTWYAGDFNSKAIYHFDALGKLLDSTLIGLPIQGLAYNPGTGHIFVLTSGGAHTVYVLDAKNGFAPVGDFDVSGYNNGSSGAGFGYTCDGALWISDFVDSVAFKVASGESGWCNIRNIPWLSLAPGGATTAKGASTPVDVTINGAGQTAYTTTQAQLRLVGDTPYPVKTIPVTVSWDPQPVALVTAGQVAPKRIVKGDYATFDVTVMNWAGEGVGPATQVALTFEMPANFSYVTQHGNDCTSNAGEVVCLIGDLGPDAHKTLTIVAKAEQAGPFSVTFRAAAQEAQDPSFPGRNSVEIDGTVHAANGGSGSSSGGGAIGGASLAALLALAAVALTTRKRAHNGSRRAKFMNRGKNVFKRKTNVVAVAATALLFAAGGALDAQGAAPPQRAQVAVNDGLTAGHLGAIKRVIDPANKLVRLAPQANVSLLKQSKVLGPHPSASRISLTVSLRLRHEQQLRTFLRELQNPESPEYHHFLSPSEFTSKYGPTVGQVEQVEDFLKKHGIHVTRVSANRMLIHTEATTRVYQGTFKIRIADYTLNNRTFFASEDSPILPSGVASLIRNVVGLNNAAVMRPLHQTRALNPGVTQANPMVAPPASSSYFNPSEIQNAYDWPSITDSNQGAGVRVAILTAASSGIDPADYETFWSEMGLPDHTVNIIPVDGDKSQTGGMIETLLDMEWSGAMGPGETEDVYVASDPQFATFIDEFNQFVNDNNDQVMTTSWGAPESVWGPLAQTADQIFMQAAAQGISMFAAAGDNGSADRTNQPNMADFPSVDPYITAANGTDLTANVDGTYKSETAWNNTGGAISAIFSEPTWQTGPGVPANGWRNNSDLAMNAGPLRPYLVYSRNNGGWFAVYGTSAVAPQLAGLFAIGVWQNGGSSLGQSNELIYGDVNAGNYASDFHDVTTGSNGAYDAGVNWDHPTGWGTPRAKSLLMHLGVQGPAGTLKGTITDANTGAELNGATVVVTPGYFRRGTDANGAYSMFLAPGTYTVTVKDFGYQIATDTVSVADGNTTTESVSLEPAPKAVITGHVTDNSGHGYGLYADVKVTSPKFGDVADVWTNPKDGAYSISLPEGFDYSFSVTPAFDGYNTGNLSITNLSADARHDFRLTISGACTAPGYKDIQGFGEDFDAGFPPSGWSSVTQPAGDPIVWKKASQFYWGTLPNYTGGSGDGAVAQAASNIILNSPYDAQLISPSIPVSSLPANPTLTFLLNYQQDTSNEALDVDINVDGSGWNTVAHITQNEGGFYKFQGVKYSASLAGYIPAGAASIQLRWRYYNPVNYSGWYAEIDDVSIGACETIPGGLIYGQVSDANNGNGLVGATVADENGGHTQSIINASDPQLPVGAYLMFADSGQRAMTTSDYGYTNAVANVNVTAGVVTEHDFVLKSGRLVPSPTGFTIHAEVNSQAQEMLTVSNTGSDSAAYQVLSIDAPVPTASAQARFFPGSSDWKPGAGLLGNKALGLHRGGAGEFGAGSDVYAASAGTVAGDVVSSFRTGIANYGVGINHALNAMWLGDPSLNGGDDKDHRYLFDGTGSADAIDVALPGAYYMADMAYDDNTGKFWQVSVSQDGIKSCIYELDPKLMQWTGKKICPDFPISQRGLAYDPVNNIWIAGDFVSKSVYGFDSHGHIVGSASFNVPITGLAFNPETQHLFVLTSSGDHAIYVFNARNGFIDAPSTIDIPGFNPQNSGSGLGYDCDGHLWVSDMVDQEMFQVNSGETGWCSLEHIPWLTIAPDTGTVAAGASEKVALDIDGTGQTPFTTSKVQLRLNGTTPYAEQVVPVTVHWDPQPVAMVTTVQAGPGPVAVGQYVHFDVTVANKAVQGDGDASQVELTFNLPANLRFVPQSGIVCSGSVGTIVCDLGDIVQGASRQVTILAEAEKKGPVTVSFTAAGSEPQDGNYARANTAEAQTRVGAGGSGSGNGGGGAIGWLSLTLLLGLAAGLRRRHH